MNENLRQKLYQMFILGLDGDNLGENPNLALALESGLGGVIFFTKNIKTKSQIKELICDIKSKSFIKPFLSIDQEGGRVERTENIHSGKKYLSPMLIVQKGEEFLKKQTEQIATELKTYGFNLNFAPSVDVNTNPSNPIIGERAFSSNTDEVIKYGNLVVDTYVKNGIIPCIKHFPGHGDASVDSHLVLPVFNLSLAEMEDVHIRPFKEIFAPMIMVAHLHCPCFEKEQIPTSLSKNTITYLREKIGFEGLIITDDMVMGGVLGFDASVACAMAIKAGVNILLYRGSDDETIKIIEDLLEVAESDLELRNCIDFSFERIIQFKKIYL